MPDRRHYRDELQELLDRRLDAEREREVRSHLDGCPECRRELENLGWVKRTTAAAPEAPLPPDLEAIIRGRLASEERAHRRPRRVFLAAAASLVVGGAAAWWFRRSREPLPAVVARDYRLFRSGDLPLEVLSARAEKVEALFRERGIPFRTRVLDLAMMNYELLGGRSHRLGGRPSALFVYRGRGDQTLVCQMYEGRLDALPPPDEIREHRGFRFQIYRQGPITLVFWPEGEVVCVLAGDFGEPEIVALAFEKAML